MRKLYLQNYIKKVISPTKNYFFAVAKYLFTLIKNKRS